MSSSKRSMCISCYLYVYRQYIEWFFEKCSYNALFPMAKHANTSRTKIYVFKNVTNMDAKIS